MSEFYKDSPAAETLTDLQKQAYTRLALEEVGECIVLLAQAQISTQSRAKYGLAGELLEQAASRIRRAYVGGGDVGSKLNPGKFDFYAAALPDEPIFSLLGRDPSAPRFVLEWAAERERAVECGDRPKEDMEQVGEARALAERMREWRTYRFGAWKKSLDDEKPADK